MNPYLLSSQIFNLDTEKCVQKGKADYYQKLGIRVPKKSINNPHKLLLISNDKSVTNQSLVYQYKKDKPVIIYSPLTKKQLAILQITIKDSNTVDGSIYYFKMDMIENKLNVLNNINQVILSINLNPFKKGSNAQKFNSFLKNLFNASVNILS